VSSKGKDSQLSFPFFFVAEPALDRLLKVIAKRRASSLANDEVNQSGGPSQGRLGVGRRTGFFPFANLFRLGTASSLKLVNLPPILTRT
jgi:hypothetical protein